MTLKVGRSEICILEVGENWRISSNPPVFHGSFHLEDSEVELSKRWSLV